MHNSDTLKRIDSALTSLGPLHSYPPADSANANIEWTWGGLQAMMLIGLRNIYLVSSVTF